MKRFDIDDWELPEHEELQRLIKKPAYDFGQQVANYIAENSDFWINVDEGRLYASLECTEIMTNTPEGWDHWRAEYPISEQAFDFEDCHKDPRNKEAMLRFKDLLEKLLIEVNHKLITWPG